MMQTTSWPAANQTKWSVASGTSKTCKCGCLNWCPTCSLPKCRAEKETHWADGTLLTEYQKEYLKKMAQHDRAKPIIPGKGYVDSRAAFDGRTTNKADYVPKSASARRHRRDDRGFPKQAFDGITTYTAFFPPKDSLADRHVRTLPAPYSAPFVGISTNHADYVKKPLNERPATAAAALPPRVPFDGSSTYNADFDRKKIPERDPRDPAPLLPSVHDAGPTTYGADFVPLPFCTNRKICCHDSRHRAEHLDVLPLQPSTPPSGYSTGKRTGGMGGSRRRGTGAR